MVFHAFPLNSLMAKLISSITKLLVGELNKNIPCVNLLILRILRNIEKSYGAIDIIHSHYFTTSIAPILYRKIYDGRTRLIFHYHNKPKSNRINVWVAKKYDLSLAVSNFIKDSIIRNLGIEESRVKVVYNGVDTTIFKPCEELQEKICKKFRINDEDVVVMYVGRIVPEKGLSHVIIALHYLINKYRKKVKLLVVGPKGHFDIKEDKYFKYVEMLVSKLGLRDNVLYVGEREHKSLAEFYNAADIVVVPSLCEEAFGMVAIEAMACEKPVVTYDTGALPEIVENEKTGIVVERNDIELLAKALLELIEDKTLRILSLLASPEALEWGFTLPSTRLCKLHGSVTLILTPRVTIYGLRGSPGAVIGQSS